MHCSPSADARRLAVVASRILVATVLGMFVLAGAASSEPAGEPGFRIRAADTRLVDGLHRLDADIAFVFSAEVIDAMENGVSVTVVVEMEVLEAGRVWDHRVAAVQARYRIQVHALSRQVVVRNLSTGEASTYRSFDEMADRLGRIEGFPLLDDQVLEAGTSYRVRIRAGLDIESLPTPLRLLAYFKSTWRLSSGWTSWPLQR